MTLLRKLHRWLGLLLCGFVLVMSVTGVMLVWKPEFQRYTVAGANQPVQTDLGKIAVTLDRIIEDQPPKTINLIQVNPSNLGIYKVFLTEKRYAFYNQQGELVQLWSSNQRFEDWLLDLHHRFLLGNTVGLNIAGFSALLLVPLVFVGLLLWFKFRVGSGFKVWPEGGRPGQLLRSHRNLGVVSSMAILFVAVTGVILVYPVESAGVLLGDLSQEAKPHISKIEQAEVQQTMLDKLSYATSLYQGATLRIVRPPNQYSDEFLVGLQQAGGFNRLGNTHISFENDIPVSTANALRQKSSKRLFDFVFPLHTGQLALWYRLLLTAFGLAVTVVTSLGLVAYIKRRRKQFSHQS